MSVPEQVINASQSELDRRRFGEIAGAGGDNTVKIFRPFLKSTAGMIPLLSSSDDRFIVIGAISYGLGYFVFAGVKIDNSARSFEKVVAAINGWSQYEAQKRRP
jgi:hypothetical protein